MNPLTIGNVNYYLVGDHYNVGDNSTSKSDGINSTLFKGEIVIQEKVEEKDVLEISHNAFESCSYITKVTILAKLKAINYRAFCYLYNLKYINIPSTVSFIGKDALYFGMWGGTLVDRSVTVEFNSGRECDLFIAENNFACRTSVYVGYPSNIKPAYPSENSYAFQKAKKAVVCALSVFDFYNVTTITDMSKCPINKFRTAHYFYSRERCFIVSSLLIFLFGPIFAGTKTSIAISNQKIE